MKTCANPACGPVKRIKGFGLCENCLRKHHRGTLRLPPGVILEPRKTYTYAQRKAKYIAPQADGCWLWIGALDGRGYGVIRVEGVLLRAHRYVYEQEVGPIPPGLDLDHLCRVPACVRPMHLEPVTRAENLARGAGRGGALWGGSGD